MLTLEQIERMIYINEHPYIHSKKSIRPRRKNIPMLRARIFHLREVEGLKFKDIAVLMDDGFTESLAHTYYSAHKKLLDKAQ